MINFFRKIRHKLADNNQPASLAGRFFKYSRYAIGEIVLVVIGILIALQVNNWNQQRIKNNLFEYGLHELYSEIQSTKYIQSGILDKISFQLEKIGSLLKFPDCLKVQQVPAILVILDESGIHSWNNNWKMDFLEITPSNPDKNRFTRALMGLTDVSSGADEILKNHNLLDAMKGYLQTYNISYEIFYNNVGETYKEYINGERQIDYSDKQLLFIKKMLYDESLIADLQTLRTLKIEMRDYANASGQGSNSLIDYIQSNNPNTDYDLQHMEIIGTGLPDGQWATGIKMNRISPDDDSRWEIKQHLVDGKIKFRVDADWIVDWGQAQSNPNQLVFKGGNFTVSKGYYLIRIDVAKETFEFLPIKENNK